jgi:oligopeptide transport system substrate-binding protein
MRVSRLGFALLGFLTFVATCTPSCTDDRAGIAQLENDGDRMVYRVSIREDLTGWDPATASDLASVSLVSAIHESLYQYAYASDRYEVVPLLAADFPKVSKDGLTVTIPIRQGVKFHQDSALAKDRDLRAQDFVYALKRLALPTLQSPGWWILKGRLAGFDFFQEKLSRLPKKKLAEALESDVEGIQALDSYTLQIRLTRPFPQLLNVLAMSYTAPVPQELVRAYGGETLGVPYHPVGTGPFQLSEWKRGRHIVLERHPGYHTDFFPTEGALEFRQAGMLADAGKPLPFLDRIVVRMIADPEKAWAEFLEGRLDLMPVPKTQFGESIVKQANLAPALAAKGVRLHIEAGATFWYLSFNMRDRLLGSNKLLRQAISSAVNREQWIRRFTAGTGKKATSLIPPKVLDRPQGTALKYDYNLERARSLLAKAGYPAGKGLPVLNFDLRGADEMNHELGEFFSEQMAAIGVKVNVIYNSFPAFISKMKEAKVQISHGGWTMDYPDAENVLQLLHGPRASPGPNESNFNHPEVNRLFEELAVLSPGAKRAALISRVESIVQEELPWALGYYQTNYAVTQPWVQNYRVTESIVNKWKYLRIDRSAKRRYLDERKAAALTKQPSSRR